MPINPKYGFRLCEARVCLQVHILPNMRVCCIKIIIIYWTATITGGRINLIINSLHFYNNTNYPQTVFCDIDSVYLWIHAIIHSCGWNALTGDPQSSKLFGYILFLVFLPTFCHPSINNPSDRSNHCQAPTLPQLSRNKQLILTFDLSSAYKLTSVFWSHSRGNWDNANAGSQFKTPDFLMNPEEEVDGGGGRARAHLHYRLGLSEKISHP